MFTDELAREKPQTRRVQRGAPHTARGERTAAQSTFDPPTWLCSHGPTAVARGLLDSGHDLTGQGSASAPDERSWQHPGEKRREPFTWSVAVNPKQSETES